MAAIFMVVACERAGGANYPLVIETKTGSQTFKVELANDNATRERGLMFRTSLADDRGMLFVFDHEKSLAFWMKNTLIPLDLLFIRSNGSITHIYKNAQPHDETPLPSNGAVRAVLEIPGGQADKRGIRIGDRIVTNLLKQEPIE